MPLRRGPYWWPVIALDTGEVLGWPEGSEAELYYKVRDKGSYWLLDANRTRIARWRGRYVPDFLCTGEFNA